MTTTLLCSAVVGILLTAWILRIYRDRFHRQLDKLTKQLNQALYSLRRYRASEYMPVIVVAPTLDMARAYAEIIAPLRFRVPRKENLMLVGLNYRDGLLRCIANKQHAEIFLYRCEAPPELVDRLARGHRGLIVHLVQEHDHGKLVTRP